ncbi:FG-GAP repeat domain-containing protein [Streptomyces hydrogenans]|uniref:FG-GAP repeat domain-containing protein n=1 Tax=Streptomyces hydrogenans TaxID=1873719 RepID=UPI00278C7C70|nr:VCBS repeat-containing protein [Streptomyces hydrogenans]
MTRHRPTARRLLTAAVAVALTVTAGALTAPAATAAPAAVTAAPADAQAPVPLIQDGGTLWGAGPSGFLTLYHADGVYSSAWTRYADGVTTALPGSTVPRPVRGTDLVAQVDGSVHTIRLMDSDAEPVVLDLATLKAGYQTGQPAGADSLVTVWTDPAGGEELHLVTRTADGLRAEKIAGFPEAAEIAFVYMDSPGTALVRYSDPADTSGAPRLAVVDVARRAVVEEVVTPAYKVVDVAVTATHLAWFEETTSHTYAVVVMPRGGTPGEALRIPLRDAAGLRVALLDGWVLYGKDGAHRSYGPNPLYALTARSLKDDRTVKVLDTFAWETKGSDGHFLAQGGTLAGGEGVYRVGLGPDGVPAATQVATTGRPTALTLLGQEVPDVIDLDQKKSAAFSWNLSGYALTRMKVTHTATGRTLTWYVRNGDVRGSKTYTWNGALGETLPENGVPAPSGAYTWHLTAEPSNDIGPVLEASGAFTVKRAPVPHDYDDNGVPDLVHREYDGSLGAYNPISPIGGWPNDDIPDLMLGTGGWDAYDRIVATGNLAGTPHSDLVARDRAGVLWLYQGTGKGLARRVQVGGGWQVYNRITSAADLTGDGRTDLLAADKAGVLWLYKGTGNTSAPFTQRTRVGGGWQAYNDIAAVGNVAGAAPGDLVARDKDGVLWLYLGKGDGTFTARTRVGGGWQAYDHVFGFGDVDRDGYADLVGIGEPSYMPYVYRGTGLRGTPFAPRQSLYGSYGSFSLDLY